MNAPRIGLVDPVRLPVEPRAFHSLTIDRATAQGLGTAPARGGDHVRA